MNILLVNHYAGSPYHGMEFRPFYLAREWIKAGHKVLIVASSYSHIRYNQPSSHGLVVDENISGVQYRWYPTPAYLGNGMGRVKNIFAFLLALRRDSRRLASVFRPDVVIASSTYPMDIWPAQFIAKLSSARLVYEVHDLWPLSPIELGGMSRWHPFILLVQWAEDYAYKSADLVVSMLPKTLDYMVSRGLRPSKWRYVPNGVDVQEWSSSSVLPDFAHTVLQAVKSRGFPVLGYAGTHGVANALDVLLDAAHLLKGRIEVVLVGTGPKRDHLIRRVALEGLSNVTMLPSVPKMAMPKLLEAFDLAFIGWHANPLYRFGISPNKLMDYMMAGKPIVHSVAAGNDPVKEVGCGITVPPNNPEAITAAVLALCSMTPGQRLEMGLKGKTFVLSERTYGVLAREFLNIIESIF